MNASKYEDYNDTSATYDGARMPIDAADLKATIEGVAASTGKPLASLRVLDSGCGTANYIAALSAVLPCRFVGVDGSEGMIAQARKKFAGRANVSLSCQDITKMTFEAGSFDVVMTTQVVHHLQQHAGAHAQCPLVDVELGLVVRHGLAAWRAAHEEEAAGHAV